MMRSEIEIQAEGARAPGEGGAAGIESSTAAEVSRVAWAVMFIAMSLLAFELVVTRIFSVILWNHFAFLAISIGLFGFGVSGVAVYVLPDLFTRERAFAQLRMSALALLPSLWLVTTALCALPIRMDFSGSMFAFLAAIFVLTSLPFIVGGIGISLALTHWPRSVNRIYAFDMAGSGIGCLLVIALLDRLDGPTAALAIGALPVAAAGVLRRSGLVVGLAAIVLLGVVFNQSQQLVRIRTERSVLTSQVFEEWNAFSRVTVGELKGGTWRGWATAPKSKQPAMEAMGVTIDDDAFTPLIRFDGDFGKVAVLLDDISSVAYRIAPNAGSVLVIGSGGGKDVLTALASGAAHVRAVELNPIIARRVVMDRFREYTGDLYRHPRVDLEVGEGRTVLRHDDRRYDIVQLSMVDTSAASAAGAYALTENSLYTVEAAGEYLAHLRPGGLFTCTWANLPNVEGVNRLVSIYAEALRRSGLPTVEDKIAVISNARLATVLVRPSGFSPTDVVALSRLSGQLGFEPLYLPGRTRSAPEPASAAAVIREILTTDDLDTFFDQHRLDLRPVDDDRPFFFYQNRFRDAPAAFMSWNPGLMYGNGLFIIAKLVVISGVAVLVFMLGPLLLARRAALDDLRGSGAFFVYFFALGAGFITLEIALIQMFGYYLGHPLLGLGVSLTSMLIFTGLGSAAAGRWTSAELRERLQAVFIGIMFLVGVSSLVLPSLMEATVGSHVLLRASLVVVLIAPLGLLLGMPFPTGLRLLGEASRLTPWMWAINGGASVFGAAIATLLVLHFGFSRSLAAGGAVYGLALLSLPRRSPSRA
jgi:SAM-dependent methyltransferase